MNNTESAHELSPDACGKAVFSARIPEVIDVPAETDVLKPIRRPLGLYSGSDQVVSIEREGHPVRQVRLEMEVVDGAGDFSALKILKKHVSAGRRVRVFPRGASTGPD